MKDEIELGYLNSPASKPAVFVFKNENAENGIRWSVESRYWQLICCEVCDVVINSARQKGGSSSKTLVATLKSKVRATGKAKV